MDIKLKKHTKDWYNFIYKSWKVGSGYRNLLAVDNKGEIRDCTSIPAGFTNDQFVLAAASFFRKNALLEGTTALGDGGFFGNSDFPMDTPFKKPQVAADNTGALRIYNHAISVHKNIVERINGILKMQWRILRTEFPYRPSFFPLVFRCCCILTNRYFRLYGYPAYDN
eukprot:UN04496